MADAYLKLSYVVELSDADMKIVCLALAGKIKRQEDQKAAQELNLRLLNAQKIRLQEKYSLIEGAIRKAHEETNDGSTVT